MIRNVMYLWVDNAKGCLKRFAGLDTVIHILQPNVYLNDYRMTKTRFMGNENIKSHICIKVNILYDLRSNSPWSRKQIILVYLAYI